MSKDELDDLADTRIKWTRELKRLLLRRKKLAISEGKIKPISYRPFTSRKAYYDADLFKYLFSIPRFLPTGNEENSILVIPATGATPRVPFSVSACDKIPDLNYFSPDPVQTLPLYRYTPTGERIDNITDWGLRQFHAHYGKAPAFAEDVPAKLEEEGATPAAAPAAIPPSVPDGTSPPQGGRAKKAAAITKEDIFHYVYGVLHDPIYRETYALNLKREFPRIPFYPDFRQWADWGRRLMALHIGYETVEPWPVSRADVPDEKAREAGVAPKTILKADPDNGVIRVDGETTLSGIPKAAFSYRLGNRSGLEWILDQYKEKTPKDPTIREKFNTYRFADYKEHVIDLIGRVTRVSVETMEIVEAMKGARR